MASSGGEVDFKYDHSIYWPAFDKLTSERREERTARWEKAGKLIGESEIYLWGGNEESIGASKKVDEAITETKVDDKTDDKQAPAEANEVPKAADQAELVDGVEKLDIKQGEPVKATA